MTKELSWVSAKIPSELKARAQKAAVARRWSLSTFIEESMIEKLDYDEPVKVSQRKS